MICYVLVGMTGQVGGCVCERMCHLVGEGVEGQAVVQAWPHDLQERVADLREGV